VALDDFGATLDRSSFVRRCAVPELTDLGAAVADWSPAPVSVTDRIGAWPVAALAGLLDVPVPESLPPLWHWLGFLDHPTQAELGEDGHPAAGHFLPPMPNRRRMVAGGRLRVHSELPVGRPVERVSTLRDVAVKHGRSGDMLFVTVRHELSVGGTLAVTDEQDVVYRSQAPGQVRQLTREPGEHAAEPDWRIDVTPDEAMLFRFSALTYNTHRIHYDQPYVTGVEGYPGLVVHGPLLAVLLLEIPRRFVPDRQVVSLDYRLRAPTFAGESVAVTGTRDGERIRLAARVPGLADSVSGVAGLAPLP
jgi:3-methylfumaryl-CoA hydratase